MARRDRQLLQSTRFELLVEGDPPSVVKRGDPDRTAREAAALREMTATGLAPALLSAAPGEVRCQLVDGRPRRLGRLRPTDAQALGAALRRVHDQRRTATGGLHTWPRRVRSLRAYATWRMRDLYPLPPQIAAWAEPVAARFRPVGDPDPLPFRMLHGDLMEQNILWTPRPVFIDWEFWRMGDPAEDLASLVALNEMPRRVRDGILAGYGDAGMQPRMDAWLAPIALDAGVWFLRNGDSDAADQMFARARAFADASVPGR